MRKILFAALAAAFLATGCQKTEIINQVGDAIGFNAALNKLTKGAADAGDANLQTQNFKVWAYYAYTDETNNIQAGSVYDGIEGMDVTYTDGAEGADGSWGTKLQYYWPGKEKSLDFFAVSTGKFINTEAKPSVAIEGMGAETLGTRKLTVTGYIVDNANANDDLMVAEFVRQCQEQNSKVVAMNFKHALSKVDFKFKTNSTGENAPIVNVTSLTIKDVATAGTLTVTEGTETIENNSDGTRVDVALAWTLVEGASDIAETFTNDNTLTTSAESYVTKLLMPQSLAGKKLKVEYTITEKQGATPRAFDIEFDLGEATVDSWGINQAITYTINLSPTTITFNPSVAPWEIVDEDTSMSN